MRKSKTLLVRQLEQKIAQGEQLLEEFTNRRAPETKRACSLLQAEIDRKRMALRAMRAGRI